MDAREVLFRREASRLLAVLVRVLGVEHLALAEDVVQETLARAFEAWSYEGVPEHYAALLTTSAKNRARDALRRARTARRLEPDVARFVAIDREAPSARDPFLPGALHDDELRMMFTCAEPRLPEDVQIALVLKILCGFGVREIASAFLTTPAAIEKRLARGKRQLAASRRLFDLDAEDFDARLATVRRVLYLLFNEGYHSASSEAVVRGELCQEAMRLARLLVDHPRSAVPATFALAALFELHAARLPARVDDAGELRDLFEQDRARWDAGLIAEGLELLARSASGTELTAVHVEAAIAALHASSPTVAQTPWAEIVALYDRLLELDPSPSPALGRAIALAELRGPEVGLAALHAIQGKEKLEDAPFFAAALGELTLRAGRKEDAKLLFSKALQRARNDGERRFLNRKVRACEAPAS